MTEHEAWETVASIVGSTAIERLEALAALVVEENERQNLIGRSTVPSLWQRHILDSVQLLNFAPKDWGTWLDIGSGGGFPGLAIGCVVERPVILAEPRALRADFLRRAVSLLGLRHVEVLQSRVEQIQTITEIISARAVATPDRLLSAARACAAGTTTWLLPIGRQGEYLTAIAQRQPTMRFHVERSLADPPSAILVGVGIPR